MEHLTNTGPYIPKSDGGKANWMDVFLNGVTKSPKTYGIDAHDLEEATRVVNAFLDAYRAASDHGERTMVDVQNKNDARAQAVECCRALAMRIKADPNVTDAQKKRIGIHIDDNVLTPTAPPSAGPKITVRNTSWDSHEIRFRAGDTNTSKAKPKGATHLMIYAVIGDEPDFELHNARLIAACTKQPFEVRYPAGKRLEGKYATYHARWLTGRGDFGPWSNGVSKIIAGASAGVEVPFAHIFDADESVLQKTRVAA